MPRKAVLWTAVGAALAALAAGLFLASGFRLFAIMSPSMGQTAPVGSLVVSQPADSYTVDDVISFHRGERVYTHRVVALDAAGFVTRGDLNATEDPLPVAQAEVIGRAVFIAPGLGWLLTGLPWLLLGGVVVFLLSLLGTMETPWRWVIRISGWTLVVALVALWLRPWINLDMLGFVPAEDGGVLMHVVNTGLFPLDADGSRLFAGQDAVLHVTEQNSRGSYTLTPAPSLDLWQRILVMLVCLVPFAASFLIQPEPTAAALATGGAGPTATHERRRRMLLVALLVLTVVATVAMVNRTLSYGSLGAVIQNTKDTAGSRNFFTCENAISSLGTSSTYAAWEMSTARATTSNEPDLSGNTSPRYGRYLVASTTSTSIGCKRDTPAASITFNGNQCLYVNSNYATSGYTPNTFSLEAWFRTSTKSNGRIIGFGNSRNTAGDGNYDRHIYIDKDGRVVFGVYPGSVKVVYSPAGTNYADNAWHHVVATLSPAGQFLYVDGSVVPISAPGVTSAEPLHGYWKVGCGGLSGWQNAATAATGSTTLDYNGPSYFTGQIQFAAVYTVALSPTQVQEHYQAGQA